MNLNENDIYNLSVGNLINTLYGLQSNRFIEAFYNIHNYLR